VAISYQNSTSAATSGSATTAITAPAHSGLSAGDLLVATWAGEFVAADTQTLPPNFVLLEESLAGTSQHLVTAVGVADGTETDFTFTNSTSRNHAVWVDRYTGDFDATSINNVVDSVSQPDAGAAATAYVAPSADAGSETNTLVACGYEHQSTGGTRSFDNGVTDRGNIASTSVVRRASSGSKIQAASGVTGATTLTDASSRWNGATVVIKEQAGEPPATETLRPDTGGTVTNLSAYDATKINEPVDTDDAEWLTGTDPSGATGLTNGPEFVDGPATATAWSGATGASWGTYANVIDTSDATLSTVTLAATNTDYQNYLSFAAGDFSDIPAGSIITGISIDFRHTIGTANRVQQHITLATANGTTVGDEVNVGTNSVSTTALAAVTNGVKTIDAFGAFPTRDQLATGFGIRLRQRRSNTSTISIYSIKATVTYTAPGSTVHTEVRIPLTAVVGDIDEAAPSTVNVRIRPLGNGAGNPQVRVEAYETTDINTLGTLKATPIANTNVTANGTLTGTIPGGSISNFNNAALKVVGTGVAGKLVEFGAAELVAPLATTILAGTTRAISYDIRALVGQNRQILFDVYGLTGQSRTLAFDVRGRAGQSRQILYDVRAFATALRQISYDIRGYATATRQVRYDVYGLAGASRQILYDVVAAALMAGVSRQILYDVRALAGQTRQVRYDVYGLAGQSRTLTFDVRALVGQSRQILYDVYGRAGQSRQIRYDVYDLAGVSRQIRYDVRAFATALRQILYHVYGRTTITRQILYDIYNRAGTSRQIRYDVRGLAGASRDVLFDVLANAILAGISRQILYDVHARAGTARQIRYDVYGRAGTSREISYDLREFAGVERTVLFDVYNRASASRQIRYDVYDLAGLEREILYDVFGLVGVERQILYNIASFLVEYAIELEGRLIAPVEFERRLIEAAELEPDSLEALQLESTIREGIALDRRLEPR
jgi:hypothetical protein